MNEQVTIYALVDAAGLVHYIGQTRRLEQRRREHRRALPALTMIVVTRTDGVQADEVERMWIERYRAQGVDLLNGPRYIPRGRRSESLVTGHAVMLNLPDEMMDQLRAAATRRRIPVATAARLLLGERLDEDEMVASKR